MGLGSTVGSVVPTHLVDVVHTLQQVRCVKG
jgi:hypothetical protein